MIIISFRLTQQATTDGLTLHNGGDVSNVFISVSVQGQVLSQHSVRAGSRGELVANECIPKLPVKPWHLSERAPGHKLAGMSVLIPADIRLKEQLG